ncbi:MAG: hypothetical protein GF315_10525 [candidate division Zixibacteria bacterium]|nr:hypothetical protein [candidate division Zixibacteria bacterium]
MAFYDNMIDIDRRWIYLVLALAVMIPAIIPFTVPVAVTPEVNDIFQFVDTLEAGDYMFLGIDYDPSSMAELHPMCRAIMAHCFSKDINLIMCSLSQNGQGMAEQIIDEISARYNKKSGEDYCFLGYKPYFALVILTMGLNFRVTYPNDVYGVSLDEMPVMDGIRNYNDCAGVIGFESGNIADAWIAYANGRYDTPVALGVTGVMAANYYPYLQTGQLFGLMPGMKGAAEYETLFKQRLERLPEKDPSEDERMVARESMAYQTTSHIVILFFIIISNIGFFLSRKHEKKII